MSWPLSHDFNEAIQNPQTAFADPDLKGGEAVVGATGLPLPRSGNFADVYQIRGADGRDWAVKCFTRPVAGLAERYARVSEALERADLPFAVGFTFLVEGIRVGGAWRPVVKMEWVEGLLLNQVVREKADRPETLAKLGRLWVKLCKRLREAGVAHADVQHGNVILVPGGEGRYGLKLIDYDGMWVPALTNTPSGESGHPSYQHPARAATRAYSPDVDRFPHLVVATALRGLALIGPALWERYDNGDNLLFTEDDYKRPAESKLMKELWNTDDPAVQGLVGRLAIACGNAIPQTAWLDQLTPDGEPVPLDAATRRAAAAALGLGPALTVAADWGAEDAPAVPAEPGAAPTLTLPPQPSRAREPGRGTKPAAVVEAELAPTRSPKPAVRAPRPRAKPSVPVWAWAAGAAVAVCVVIGAVVAFRPKPVLTVQNKPVDEPVKPKEPLAPKLMPEPPPPSRPGGSPVPMIPAENPPPLPGENHPAAVPLKPAPAGVVQTEDDAVALVKKLNGSVSRDVNRAGNPVVYVQLMGPRVTNEELKGLTPLTSLTRLMLSETSVTDAGLKELAGLKNLTRLDLHGAKVTGVGLKELTPLTSLTTLTLYETQVTDAGLKELTDLKSITTLTLRGTNVMGAGLKELTPLTSLTTLDLRGTKVTDAGLNGLAGLASLTTLTLTGVTDAGLKELAGLKSITTLDLQETKVTDAGVKTLTTLRNLTALTLHSSTLTDAGVKELSALTNLTTLHLHLSGSKVTVEGLKSLSAIRTLTTLGVSSAQMTDAGVKALSALTDLTTLYLSLSPKVTDAGVKELSALKKLTTLHLSGAQVTDAGLSTVGVLTKLTALTLDGSKVTDKGLKALLGLPNLTTLTLLWTPVTGEGLKELSGLTNLTTLHLIGLQVTDAGVKELATLKNLTTLNLLGPQVTDVGVKELPALANLTKLYLNGVQMSDSGVKKLATLTKLTHLSFGGLQVTDAGVKNLTALTNLTSLSLSCPKLTGTGVNDLYLALPKCHIHSSHPVAGSASSRPPGESPPPASASPPIPGPKGKGHAVPAGDEVVAVRERFRATFKAEYDKLTPASAPALAAKLLTVAKDEQPGSANRYALLVEVMQLSEKSANLGGVIDSALMIGQDYNAPDLKDMLATALAQMLATKDKAEEFNKVAASELEHPMTPAARIALGKEWLSATKNCREEFRHLVARRARLLLLDGLASPVVQGLDRVEAGKSVQEAVGEIETADAKAGKFTLYSGKWSVKYDNKYTHEYAITADGALTFDRCLSPDGAVDASIPRKDEHKSKLVRRGGEVVTSFGQGRILERFELRGEKLAVDRFDPAKLYPKTPSQKGEGTRTNAK